MLVNSPKDVGADALSVESDDFMLSAKVDQLAQ